MSNEEEEHKELDRSWLPESKLLPDGGVSVTLPSESEWLLAGGKVKKETKSMPAFNIVDSWREDLEKWITRWQDKHNQEGKAPKPFVRAYEVLADAEEMEMGVDFISIGEVESRLKKRTPGITAEEIALALKFIEPLLVKTELKLKVIKLEGPEG